jgi:hypothetical protein
MDGLDAGHVFRGDTECLAFPLVENGLGQRHCATDHLDPDRRRRDPGPFLQFRERLQKICTPGR